MHDYKNFAFWASLGLLLSTACGKDESFAVLEEQGPDEPIPTVQPGPTASSGEQPEPTAPTATGAAPTGAPQPTSSAGPEPSSEPEPEPEPQPEPDVPAPVATEPVMEEVPEPGVFALFGAPLVFNPTPTAFGINAVFVNPDESQLRAYVSLAGSGQWGEVTEFSYPAEDVVEWSVRGLSPGTTYDYAIMAVMPGAEGVVDEAVEADPAPEEPSALDTGSVADSGPRGMNAAGDAAAADASDGPVQPSPDSSAPSPGDDDSLPWIGLPGTLMYRGTVTTQRPPGEPYRFALITDTHISPRDVSASNLDEAVDTMERILLDVADDVQADVPDFIVNLGDMLDFHQFGFNAPPPDGSWTRLAYLNYRRLLQDALGNAAHFPVIGNWDGENGDFTQEQIAYSREQRLRYIPGPEPDTYPFGGNVDEDYYAFTWGDATFITLNVMTYTPTSHLLGNFPGVADDWTLGEAQLDWLIETLEQVDTKWRFILIHHVVGGAAGDEVNAAYGRGGGQAAQVGEQALVHDLMLEYGVQVFFYGHDHVFTDIVVDDIHYTLPGSAGAPWKFTTAETGYQQYWPDSGFARVDVSPERLTVEFVSMIGEVLYSYELEQ